MIDAMFEKAVDVAIKNSKDYRHRLGAVIFKRGTIISTGWNQAKTHPLQAKFKDRPQKDYLHAEVHGVVRGLRCRSLLGCSIVVVRVLRNNSFGSSFPCPGCLACLNEVGIKHIVYYDDGINEVWL